MTNRAEATGTPATRFRGMIFVCVFAAAFILYVQRTTIGVVAVPLTHEQAFSPWQQTLLLTAFMLTYTFFQIPGGLFGQKVGARFGTLCCILLSTLGTAAFATAPYVAAGAFLFALLFAARLVIGVAQGPLFPINSGLVQAWFPPRRWSLMNGLQVMGLSLGAAATPPIVAFLTAEFGWQSGVFATCVPGIALAAAWWWLVRDTPREHAAVNAAEVEAIEAGGRPPAARRLDWSAAIAVLGNRSVLLLTLAYLLQNYVFYFYMNWSFIYLVESRGLSLPTTGVLAMIPLLVGALCAALGGYLCDLFCARFGPRWGFRILPLIVLPLVALMLFIIMELPTSAPVGLAIAALAACFGFAQMTEAPQWGAAFWVAPGQASAATGVLNCGGNIGGIIGTILVGYLRTNFGWSAAFATGMGFALASAAVWLLVDTSRRVDAAPASASP